jgi:hypothetical protein
LSTILQVRKYTNGSRQFTITDVKQKLSTIVQVRAVV